MTTAQRTIAHASVTRYHRSYRAQHQLRDEAGRFLSQHTTTTSADGTPLLLRPMATWLGVALLFILSGLVSSAGLALAISLVN